MGGKPGFILIFAQILRNVSSSSSSSSFHLILSPKHPWHNSLVRKNFAIYKNSIVYIWSFILGLFERKKSPTFINIKYRHPTYLPTTTTITTTTTNTISFGYNGNGSYFFDGFNIEYPIHLHLTPTIYTLIRYIMKYFSFINIIHIIIMIIVSNDSLLFIQFSFIHIETLLFLLLHHHLLLLFIFLLEEKKNDFTSVLQFSRIHSIHLVSLLNVGFVRFPNTNI